MAPPGRLEPTQARRRARRVAVNVATSLWDPIPPSTRRRWDEGEGLERVRRLTLVLGLLPSTEVVLRAVRDPAPTASDDPAPDHKIAVQVKLNKASMSVIEAAELLAQTCSYRGAEAVILEKMVGIIDDLDEVIRGFHEVHECLPDNGSANVRGKTEIPSRHDRCLNGTRADKGSGGGKP